MSAIRTESVFGRIAGDNGTRWAKMPADATEESSVRITNKHKLSKKHDDKVAARRRIRRHDFESVNSKNGRANLKKFGDQARDPN